MKHLFTMCRDEADGGSGKEIASLMGCAEALLLTTGCEAAIALATLA